MFALLRAYQQIEVELEGVLSLTPDEFPHEEFLEMEQRDEFITQFDTILREFGWYASADPVEDLPVIHATQIA